MYAIKGSWVGQTCASATSNDSAGRKSRIRRSKEERKAMVESFIKRYQISNDGNFPSLNLTHKEVGGSFYTVREIVREIIQENKVLGPARFDSEEQKNDTIAGDYSLGSFSSDPQVLLSVNELDVIPKHRENESAGLTLEGNGYYTNDQDLDSLQCSSNQQADEMSEDSDKLAWRKSLSENDQQYVGLEPPLNKIGQFIKKNHTEDGRFANGTCTNGIVEESVKLSVEGSPVSETSERDKEMELAGACNAELTLPTQELVVETFPLRPVIKEIDDMSTTSAGSQNINGTLNNLGTKHAEISNDIPDLDKVSSSDTLSDTVTAKGADGSQHPMSDPVTVVQHVEINDKTAQHEEADLTDETLERLDSSAIKDGSPSADQVCKDEIASHSGLSSKTVEEIHESQSKNAPKGMTYKETSSSGTTIKTTNSGSAFAVANGNYIRRDNKAISGVSPTVDRIDLESWESKRTSNQETNPLVAIFKAFVNAFAKFWSA